MNKPTFKLLSISSRAMIWLQHGPQTARSVALGMYITIESANGASNSMLLVQYSIYDENKHCRWQYAHLLQLHRLLALFIINQLKASLNLSVRRKFWKIQHLTWWKGLWQTMIRGNALFQTNTAKQKESLDLLNNMVQI